MNRTGLFIALSIAAVVGLVFGLYPKLDLALVAPFFDGRPEGWLRFNIVVRFLRTASTWVVALVAAPAVIAVVVKLLWPRWPMLIPGRAALLMILTLLFAPGVVTNVILKDHWGRPRPIDVTNFGGGETFVPWWDPRGKCNGNCSFVAGEPSGAFWTMAPAFVVPPPWRVLALGGALTFGAGVGLLRMMAGAHFFSDVAFAGVFTFLVIWLTHGVIYRWRPFRITDAVVERALERLAWPSHLALTRGLARLRQRSG
jgi:lipid A 4'-phosphatase